MRIFVKFFILLSLPALISCSGTKKSSKKPNPFKGISWTIDLDQKVIIGYWPQGLIPKTSSYSPPLFGNWAKPDLMNRKISDYKKWGYNLPPLKISQTVMYEKYFRYPVSLSPLVSAQKNLELFKFSTFKKYYLFKKHIESSKNFMVSLLNPNRVDKIFNVKKPYPQLKNPKVIYQEQFDKQILFTRFFIKPKFASYAKLPDSELEQTQLANKAFHRFLLNKYKKQFKLLETTSTHHLFLTENINFKVKVIKVPVKVIDLKESFSKYLIPHKYHEYYISSLIPLIGEVYVSKALEETPLEDLQQLKENYKLESTHVLEVATAHRQN